MKEIEIVYLFSTMLTPLIGVLKDHARTHRNTDSQARRHACTQAQRLTNNNTTTTTRESLPTASATHILMSCLLSCAP